MRDKYANRIMPQRRKWKKWTLICLAILLVVGAASIVAVDYRVEQIGKTMLVDIEDAPRGDAIVVLGAYVAPDGTVSDMLRDRLDYGYKLYVAGKAPKIIVSGDHGREDYNEVGAMRDYLLSKGVPAEDIFMDHAGFSTYDTVYRARDIFLVEKPLFVSQQYHVVRVLYTAKQLGMDAYGVASDAYIYPGMLKYRLREYASRCKAYLQAELFVPEPKFLGHTIPVWGDGTVTDDSEAIN